MSRLQPYVGAWRGAFDDEAVFLEVLPVSIDHLGVPPASLWIPSRPDVLLKPAQTRSRLRSAGVVMTMTILESLTAAVRRPPGQDQWPTVFTDRWATVSRWMKQVISFGNWRDAHPATVR